MLKMMTRHYYLQNPLNKAYESVDKALCQGEDSIAYEDMVAVLLLDELMSEDTDGNTSLWFEPKQKQKY